MNDFKKMDMLALDANEMDNNCEKWICYPFHWHPKKWITIARNGFVRGA